MSSEISFRIAKQSEFDKVLQFLRDYYFTEESISRAYPEEDDIMEEEFLLSLLPHGNVIVAIDTANDEIAGVVCFGEVTKNCSAKSLEEAESTTNAKWRDILKFMSYVEAKSNICERYGVEKALHVHGISVNKNYRGQSLGKRLSIECFHLARERGYKLMSTDCTSIYSIQIAISFGMEFVSSVTYDEYHEKIGRKIFNPIPPHTEIQSFVKRL